MLKIIVISFVIFFIVGILAHFLGTVTPEEFRRKYPWDDKPKRN